MGWSKFSALILSKLSKVIIKVTTLTDIKSELSECTKNKDGSIQLFSRHNTKKNSSGPLKLIY